MKPLLISENRNAREGNVNNSLEESKISLVHTGIPEGEKCQSHYKFKVVTSYTRGIEEKSSFECHVSERGDRAPENSTADSRQGRQLLYTETVDKRYIAGAGMNTVKPTNGSSPVGNANKSEWVAYRLAGAGSKHTLTTSSEQEKLIQDDTETIRELPEVNGNLMVGDLSDSKKLPKCRVELKGNSYHGVVNLALDPTLEKIMAECMSVLHRIQQEYEPGIDKAPPSEPAEDKKGFLYRMSEGWKKFRDGLAKFQPNTDEADQATTSKSKIWYTRDKIFRRLTKTHLREEDYNPAFQTAVSTPFPGPKKHSFTRGTSIDEIFLLGIGAWQNDAKNDESSRSPDSERLRSDEGGYVTHEIHPEYFTDEGMRRRPPRNAEEVGKYYPGLGKPKPRPPRKRKKNQNAKIDSPGTSTDDAKPYDFASQLAEDEHPNKPFYVGTPPDVYICQKLTENQYREQFPQTDVPDKTKKKKKKMVKFSDLKLRSKRK